MSEPHWRPQRILEEWVLKTGEVSEKGFSASSTLALAGASHCHSVFTNDSSEWLSALPEGPLVLMEHLLCARHWARCDVYHLIQSLQGFDPRPSPQPTLRFTAWTFASQTSLEPTYFIWSSGYCQKKQPTFGNKADKADGTSFPYHSRKRPPKSVWNYPAQCNSH